MLVPVAQSSPFLNARGLIPRYSMTVKSDRCDKTGGRIPTREECLLSTASHCCPKPRLWNVLDHGRFLSPFNFVCDGA